MKLITTTFLVLSALTLAGCAESTTPPADTAQAPAEQPAEPQAQPEPSAEQPPAEAANAGGSGAPPRIPTGAGPNEAP